jgi:hypothetical protein
MQSETPEELGRRIAALYRELSYPSAAKFRTALRKKGIQLSAESVKELVADQGARQLTAPPPRWIGHVTATRINERWAADVMDFTAKATKGSPSFILVVQDVFSRFLFARALRSKTEVEAAFLRMVKGRKVEELNTDKGSEFMNREFQAMLRRHGIYHRVKVGPQDLATLDRAIGTLRATLSRRTVEGGPWYEELEAGVASINNTEHGGIFMREPAEVADDDDLRFDLRYRNVELARDNVELATKRATRLREKGAFRVLLAPTTLRRRAGQQNWSEKIHIVANTSGAIVTDTEGASFAMSMTQAVSTGTAPVAPSSFTQGGDTRVTERRRIALQPWLPDILRVLRRTNGLSVQMLGKTMKTVAGFTAALKEQRATMSQVVDLFPQSIEIRRQAGVITVVAREGAAVPAPGTLDAFGS